MDSIKSELERKRKSTAQKMKCSIKDFFSKCDQIRRNLRIWSHLLKKSLMAHFIFCVVSAILAHHQARKEGTDDFVILRQVN